MKKILLLLVMLSGLYSITINIPDDYSTIQEGIDVAVDGDTVLVADGDYQENLVISKSIVLASHAIFDDLDDWVAYDDIFYEQWVINNSHIANTRIIGNNPSDGDYGSVILITPDFDTCISPEITGFTIQYGLGTLVERDSNQVRIGGGILADISNPLIKYNAFVNNGSPSLASGGAIQLTSSAEDWSFNDRFENVDPRCEVEEFRISDNLYDGNDALYGNSVANRFHQDSFDMSGSIFDVFNCGADLENSISSVWVDVEDEASVDYSESEGNLCAFTSPDVYVDSNIEQECLEEGCGFINNPYKTITRTLEMILPTEENSITIHLAAGTYSPETGESFPLIMESNVNIEGEDEETTILDAMQTGGVIMMEFCDNNTISAITIMGGYTHGYWGTPVQESGGGIHLSFSSPILNHLIIKNNSVRDAMGAGMYLWNSNATFNDVKIINNINTDDYGGGIYLFESNPLFTNVIISNNIAEDDGGGMVLDVSHPTLKNVIISDNMAEDGGGIVLFESNPIFINVIISNNMAEDNGGILLVGVSNPNNLIVTNSIIWGNNPESNYLLSVYEDAIITYSNIEGGWEAEGNINADPLFTDPENGDYTLQEDSPCIDAGTADLDGDGVDDITDYYGSAPDMGAFEFGESSEMAGDTNFDGIVDILDIVNLVNIIMNGDDYNYLGDMNNDGINDILDIVNLVNVILNP